MLKKAFLTNSSGILCSRIFGFLRDLSMANILGAGIYSDIFFVAFKFPNLFRRVFGEGAFTQSFLPNLISSSKKGAFTVLVLVIFSSILLFLSLFVVCFSSGVTRVLALGFDSSLIEIASPIVAIHFWYLLLVFWVTFFSALLQYKQHFWVSAYNTALLNIAMIATLFLAQGKDELEIVYFVSFGVLLGGAAQVGLHFYPLWRLGFCKVFVCGVLEIKKAFFSSNSANALSTSEGKDALKNAKNETNKTSNTNKAKSLATKIKSELKSFFSQFLPAMLGSSTAQIASFIDTILASFLASGSISYLYYANRIFQLPLAIFAIAISTALFPMVAKSIKANQEQKALQSLKKSFWFLCFALLACAIGGIMLDKQIIWLLYEHGRFARADTLECALVFAGYMIGLVPFGLSRIFSLYLYATMRQALAAKISAISLAVGVVFSLIFMQFWGAFGLALAGSLSGFVLFLLTIKAFGFAKFWGIIADSKLGALLVAFVGVEVGVLSLWLAFVEIP